MSHRGHDLREVCRRTISRSPMSREANCEVPPFSLPEHRRIKVFTRNLDDCLCLPDTVGTGNLGYGLKSQQRIDRQIPQTAPTRPFRSVDRSQAHRVRPPRTTNADLPRDGSSSRQWPSHPVAMIDGAPRICPAWYGMNNTPRPDCTQLRTEKESGPLIFDVRQSGRRRTATDRIEPNMRALSGSRNGLGGGSRPRSVAAPSWGAIARSRKVPHIMRAHW